jgi:hypothetical protein
MKILKSASPLHLQFTLCAPLARILTLTLFVLQAPAQAQQAEGFFERHYKPLPPLGVPIFNVIGGGEIISSLTPFWKSLGYEKNYKTASRDYSYFKKYNQIITLKDLERLKREGVAVMYLNHPGFNAVWEEFAPNEYHALQDAEKAYRSAQDNLTANRAKSLEMHLKDRLTNAGQRLNTAKAAFEKKQSELGNPSFWETNQGKTMNLRLTEMAKRLDHEANQLESLMERANIKDARMRGAWSLLGAYLLVDGAFRFVVMSHGRDAGWVPLVTAIEGVLE